MINEDWENSDQTSLMWEVISNGKLGEFVEVLQEYPELAHVRSKDGRGPMWWAHENKRPKMINVLQQLGVSEDRTDAKGVKPTDLSR
jgi:dolichyl-diphosphooligosaccharide--protein glycosyltransferase